MTTQMNDETFIGRQSRDCVALEWSSGTEDAPKYYLSMHLTTLSALHRPENTVAELLTILIEQHEVMGLNSDCQIVGYGFDVRLMEP